MSAEKGLVLPEGTKVRMTCDCLRFKKGDIVTRVCGNADNEHSVLFSSSDYYFYLTDDHWELIEEPKQDWLIQDTNGNITKSDSFRTPKQGDKVRCKTKQEKEWSDPAYIFICFYQGKALVQGVDLGFWLFEYWNLPPQEEVTLSDGKTYIVEERGGEKILKLKN